MSTEILQPSQFDATVQLERLFLCLDWLDPVRVSGIGQHVGLRRRDFLIRAHGWVHAYCCRCADAGRRPDFDEALDLARQEYVELTEADLDAILFAQGVRDSECENYARAIRYASVQRIEDEVRSLVRDGLHAVARGLAYEARLWARSRHQKPAPNAAPPARRPLYV